MSSDQLDSSLRDLDKSIAELRKGRAAFREITRDFSSSFRLPHEKFSEQANSNLEFSNKLSYGNRDYEPKLPTRKSRQHSALEPTADIDSLTQKRNVSSQPASQTSNRMLQQQMHDIWVQVMKSDPQVTRLPAAPPVARRRGNRVADAANEALRDMKLIDIQSEVDDLREAILEKNVPKPINTKRMVASNLNESSTIRNETVAGNQMSTRDFGILLEKIDKISSSTASKNQTIENLEADMREAKENLKYSLDRNSKLETELESLKRNYHVDPNKHLGGMDVVNPLDATSSYQEALKSLERELLKVRKDAEEWRRKEAEAQTKLLSTKLHIDEARKDVKKTADQLVSTAKDKEEKRVLQKAMEFAVEEANQLKQQLNKFSGTTKTKASSKKRQIRSRQGHYLEELGNREEQTISAARNLAIESDTIRARISEVLQQRRKHSSISDTWKKMNAEVRNLNLKVREARTLIEESASSIRNLKQAREREIITMRGEVAITRKITKSDNASSSRRIRAIEERQLAIESEKVKLENETEKKIESIHTETVALAKISEKLDSEIDAKKEILSKDQTDLKELLPVLENKQHVFSSRESVLETLSEQIQSLEEKLQQGVLECDKMEKRHDVVLSELRESKELDRNARKETHVLLEEYDDLQEEIIPFQENAKENQREYKKLSKVISDLEASAKENRENTRQIESKTIPVDRKTAELNMELDRLGTEQTDLTFEIEDMEKEERNLELTLRSIEEKTEQAKTYIKKVKTKSVQTAASARQAISEAHSKKQQLVLAIEQETFEVNNLEKQLEERNILLNQDRGKIMNDSIDGDKTERAIQELEAQVEQAELRIREEMDIQHSELEAREAESQFVWNQLRLALETASDEEVKTLVGIRT